MSIEQERGCGLRKIGKLYLVGRSHFFECDRLPMELDKCSTCGHGIKFSRNAQGINAYKQWGNHIIPGDKLYDDVFRWKPCDCGPLCPVCTPPDGLSFVMFVGEKYYPTPDDFMKEAEAQGISKRVPSIPRDIKIGKTVIYLGHKKAVKINKLNGEPLKNGQAKLIPDEEIEYRLGIFATFVPQGVETLIKKSDLTDEKREDLEKRGITPIEVPDDDHDHDR